MCKGFDELVEIVINVCASLGMALSYFWLENGKLLALRRIIPPVAKGNNFEQMIRLSSLYVMKHEEEIPTFSSEGAKIVFHIM